MSRLPSALRSRLRSARRSLPVDRHDRPWLGTGLAAGLLAVAVYLATNPYPAYGAGLYVRLADGILASGYGLPPEVSGYTAEGTLFAYPPLGFYLLAVLLDLGFEPVIVARFLPGAAVVAGLVPMYLLTRDYTGSRPAGAAAAVAIALNPQLIQWHLSAGGVVRAVAFGLALTAIYAGYHVFETGSRRALAAGLLAFGATLLTHPTYALFVVVSYLLLWAVRERSATGFARGAVVGLGGIAVASPWVGWLAATHGLDVLFGAAGTHGGIGGGVATLLDGFTLALLPLAGAAYLLWRGERFLPAWAVAAELLFAQPRFAFTVGSVVLGAVAVDVAGRLHVLDGPLDVAGRFPMLSDSGATVDRRAALAAACLLVGTLAGGLYLGYETTLPNDPSTPEFLDGEAVEALEWARTETPPDATFVVLGDAAEWFPALTDRTILVGPWGVEWRGPAAYDRQYDAYEAVSRCRTVDCVESAVPGGHSPSYVYVPRGRYTVLGRSHASFGTLERSFERAPGWERAFENDGVVVYRAVDAN